MSFCLFQSIENRKWAFLKKSDLDLFKVSFSKSFQTFLSLFDSARLHNNFFVVFLLNVCKVFPSLSRYVHYTLSFSFIFSFTCIFSCICGLCSDCAKIGAFDVSSQILWNWSLGFAAIVLYSWSMLVNSINLGFWDEFKILGLVLNSNWVFFQFGLIWWNWLVVLM